MNARVDDIDTKSTMLRTASIFASRHAGFITQLSTSASDRLRSSGSASILVVVDSCLIANDKGEEYLSTTT